MKFIIDKEKLEKLLKDFYTLTKIRIVVFDTEFNEIVCYPNHHSTYCKILRKCERAKEKCSLCDKEACIKSKATNETIIYRCYAGLVEAVTPIKHGDIQVGFIMFGQILQTDNYDKSWSEIIPIISKFDIDVEALEKAYYKKKNLTPDKISATASILNACSSYLYLSKTISINTDSIENRINSYILNNLSDYLSADILCEKFDISKNRLYEISEYSYGCGIAEHIRKLRIEKSKKLLTESNKKISEIAYECGIPDYNYFTKVFKNITGITPREYRNQNK
jgi:YesN/AraC family two-component response regulator